MIRILSIALLVFVADQASKWLVVEYMDLRSIAAIDIFPPYFNFRMAWNQGINFGLFSNETDLVRWVLIAISIAISGWLLLWGRRSRDWIIAISIGFIIGGALGNSLDRVIYGAVADFLNMSCCGVNNPFAFNLADIAIFSGAFGLILFSNRLEKNG